MRSLFIAGLGGGTGSGGAPVVAKYLQRIYTEPVYGLGILPGSDEGGIYTLNAARSFKTFVDEVDNLLVFDNDSWRQSGESVAEGYTSLNRELVSQFGLLFRAGEIEANGDVAESVVDSSEIINTLASGGITTLGYAESQLQDSEGGDDGLLSSFSQSEPEVNTTESINRVTSLVRQATLGRLTLPCEVGSTQRALVVTGGPPAHLSRKGIERSRKWLEEETDTMEVRGGDYPYSDSGVVSVAVVLSGVTNIPRIKELQQVAVEAQDNIEEIKQEQQLEDDLMNNEELDSLF
ncbi:MAG: cell division GTPase [uncultured archaeon A07HR60]|nr:MAG: cell division GTPase [uncultured archaeon A07HR60]